MNEVNVKKEIAQDLYHELAVDSGNASLFDMVVDLKYENGKLKDMIQTLQVKLNKAYEFMAQFTLEGRSMLDVFKERIGEARTWMREKMDGYGR